MNTQNGKVYIGQSRNTQIRFRDHKFNEHNIHLRRAFELYGLDVFMFEVLENDVPESEATQREAYYIQLYDARNPLKGYNIREAGSTGGHSEATKQKLREARLGTSLSMETREKLSKLRKGRAPWNKGKRLTEDQKRNLHRSGQANSNYGHKWTEAQKAEASARKRFRDSLKKVDQNG